MLDRMITYSEAELLKYPHYNVTCWCEIVSLKSLFWVSGNELKAFKIIKGIYSQ